MLGAEDTYRYSRHIGKVIIVYSSMDSDLEAFSHNPTDGSLAALAFQLTAVTNYLNQRFLSLLDGLNPAHVPYCGEQSNNWRVLLRNDRRADIENQKQLAMDAWLHKPVIPVVTFLTPLA
ncbi:hypothetical protein GQ600_10481 [Phytophthora cactorum]|nr:hypothetical protein GQ600_10481 [Phytophthora cactorum]